MVTRGKAEDRTAEAGTPPALRQPSLVMGRQGTTPSITPSITPLPGASYIHEKRESEQHQGRPERLRLPPPR